MENVKQIQGCRRSRADRQHVGVLLLLRRVRDVRVEGDGQQRVIVEESVSCANDGLAVIGDVPGKAEARRNVIRVAREALLHAEPVLKSLEICCREADAGERIVKRNWRDGVRQFHVVTHTVVEREISPNFPGVLREEGYRAILDRALRIAEALNEHARECPGRKTEWA